MTTSRRTKAGWCFILVLMVAGAPHAAWGLQDEAVLLRLAPGAGSEAVYETVDTLQQSIESMGHGTIVETSVRRLTVPEAAGDLRLLKILVESRSREQVDGTLSAEFLERFGNTKDTALGSGRIVVAHVLGPAFESVRLEDGVQLSLDSMWSGTPSLGYPLGTIELPESPVRVGDSWVASKVPTEPPPGMVLDEETHTRFRLDSLLVVAGTRRAYISFESEGWMAMSGADPDMGAIEIRAEGGESGHVEIDMESGFMVSHSSLMEARTAYVLSGRTLDMTLSQSGRTRLLPNGR